MGQAVAVLDQGLNYGQLGLFLLDIAFRILILAFQDELFTALRLQPLVCFPQFRYERLIARLSLRRAVGQPLN